MGSTILIRTFVADGERLTLHVGGGITWRSDPEDGVGRDGGQGARAAVVDRGESRRRRERGRHGPRHVWVDGELLPADATHLSAFDRGFQLGDGLFETLRARGGRVTELAEHVARLRRSADGLGIELPDALERMLLPAIAELLAAEGLGRARRRRLDPDHGLAAARGRRAACCRRATSTLVATIVIQAWPVVPRRRRTTSNAACRLVASSVRRDPQNPVVTLKTTSRADYVFARLEARREGADDALFLTLSGHLSEATTANVFLVRRAADGVTELATPSLECAILPGTTRSWLLRWADGAGLRPSRRG